MKLEQHRVGAINERGAPVWNGCGLETSFPPDRFSSNDGCADLAGAAGLKLVMSSSAIAHALLQWPGKGRGLEIGKTMTM